MMTTQLIVPTSVNQELLLWIVIMFLSSITDEQLLTLQKGEHVYKQAAIRYTMGYFILNPFNL